MGAEWQESSIEGRIVRMEWGVTCIYTIETKTAQVTGRLYARAEPFGEWVQVQQENGEISQKLFARDIVSVTKVF